MGARSRRIERVTRAYPVICAELAQLTEEAHQGATFHVRRNELETCWYATPFVHTRDSDPLDESNFQVIASDLQRLDPEGVQIHRFGHWGFGWFERIYIRRDHPRAIETVASWVNALSDYPVADDEHYSATEWEHNHPGDGRCYSDDPDCCHIHYPHEWGYMLECPKCEQECWCEGKPDQAQCVWEGHSIN